MQLQMAKLNAPTPPMANRSQCTAFHTLLGDLATLTRNVVRLGGDRLTAILVTPTRTQHRALDLLGEATQVTPQDIVRFKEHLAKKCLAAPTINRYLSAIKSPLSWAKDNLKIAANPGAGIKYDSKGGAKKKVRRLGYD